MEKQAFSRIREYLEKTQREMGQLLGVSLKAVQSFEQGWRNIPGHIERQLLFLVAKKARKKGNRRPCWETRGCSKKTKERCPAWQFKSGELCWFINGTICNGTPQKTWKEKMSLCQDCDVLRGVLPDIARG